MLSSFFSYREHSTKEILNNLLCIPANIYWCCYQKVYKLSENESGRSCRCNVSEGNLRHSSTLKTETVVYAEKLVVTYETTRHSSTAANLICNTS
jgi:hypothetical protein